MPSRLGRYEILREIASGGMAKVYLGRVVGEGGFERLVALKVMHEHIADDPEFVAMFLDEARLAARIRHPNVVPTIDVQKTSEGMFQVMEYVDGPALHDIRKLLRRERRRMPLEIVVRVVLDALAGLHAAHELTDDDGTPLQLVHRDVTPHNILVGKDGIARLTDFGVARAEARISSTTSGRLKGKMGYMPPEMLLGAPADCRSDIYSAALVLWELLTGKRLFRADSEGELVHLILAGNPPWPHKIDPGVPLAISSVCMRAMAREPENRFATAEEFADALENAARDGSIDIAKPRRVGSFVRDLVPRLDELPVSRSGAATPASRQSELLSELAAHPPIRIDADDASNPVQGSGLTNAGAVLSMAPPRSRRGLIVLALLTSGAVLIGVIFLAMHQGSAPAGSTPAETATSTNRQAAAPGPPLPDEPPAALADPVPERKPEPAPSAKATAPPVPRPVPAPASPPRPVQPRPRPEPPSPKPSPTTFRPSGL